MRTSKTRKTHCVTPKSDHKHGRAGDIPPIAPSSPPETAARSGFPPFLLASLCSETVCTYTSVGKKGKRPGSGSVEAEQDGGGKAQGDDGAAVDNGKAAQPAAVDPRGVGVDVRARRRRARPKNHCGGEGGTKMA